MLSSNNKSQFSRRVFVLFAIQLGLFFLLVGRLFILQIRNNRHFSALSDKNHTNYVPVIPKRGLLLDYFARPLVSNEVTWQLVFIRSWLNRPLESLITALHKFIPLTKEEKLLLQERYKANTYATDIIVVKENIKDAEIATVQAYHSIFPELFINPKYIRVYPYQEAMAHPLGYVGPDPARGAVPGWDVGKQGLEYSLDSVLKGTLGYKSYERNAKGKLVKTLGITSDKPGKNVVLTIDANLQEAIFKIIGHLSASAVVLDSETGDILACVSSPSFDPNKFVTGINEKEWEKIINNPENPLNNRAVSGLYPPASTIKPFVALSALDLGIIDLKSTVECKGYLDIGNRRFHCWKHSGHGKLNVQEAITHSCDIFFYTIAQKLTKANFTDLGELLKINEKLMPLLPGCSTGNLPLSHTLHPPLGELAVAGIGQGTWLVTTLHLANMGNILANSGVMKAPQILKRIDFNESYIFSKPNKVIGALPFREEQIQTVCSALTQVIPYNRSMPWPISGKTGTAQVVRITQEQRLKGLTRETKKMYREHGMFFGYVPSDQPKYAIGIVVEHSGFASTYVVPIAKKIARILYRQHPYYEQEKTRIASLIQNA